MHTFDFKNRTAVVTGGAQGFGLDVAKRFLESGAKVFIWDIDEKLLISAVDELKNPNLFYSVVDISNYQDVEKKVADITLKSNLCIKIIFLLTSSMLSRQQMHLLSKRRIVKTLN